MLDVFQAHYYGLRHQREFTFADIPASTFAALNQEFAENLFGCFSPDHR
jgi:hypothetical protein